MHLIYYIHTHIYIYIYTHIYNEVFTGKMEQCLGFIFECSREKKKEYGTSLMAHWLRLHTPNVKGSGSIPAWGT